MFDDDGRWVAYTVCYRDKVNELNARSVIIILHTIQHQLGSKAASESTFDQKL